MIEKHSSKGWDSSLLYPTTIDKSTEYKMKKLYKGLIAMAAVAGLGIAVSDLDSQTLYYEGWTHVNGLTQAQGEYVCQTGPQPTGFPGGITGQELIIECCDSPVLCWAIPPNVDVLYVYDNGVAAPCPGNCPGGAMEYRFTAP